MTTTATGRTWPASSPAAAGPRRRPAATFSSRGVTFGDHILKPDVVAPGNRVLSLMSATGTIATSSPSSVVTLGGAPYFSLSGTSMAAPMVSGAVALMLQATPGLSPDSVKIRLMHSAIKQWNAAYAYN